MFYYQIPKTITQEASPFPAEIKVVQEALPH